MIEFLDSLDPHDVAAVLLAAVAAALYYTLDWVVLPLVLLLWGNNLALGRGIERKVERMLDGTLEPWDGP